MKSARYLGAAATLALIATTAAQAQDACPTKGGTLTFSYTAEPVALSTLRTTAVTVSLMAGKIYEGLVSYEGPEMTPVPGLAESWDISEDGTVYTFHLRDGVKWHDGEPFTSADVKFGIENAIRPYHSRGKIFFGNVTSIETPDPLTVIFTLASPVEYFMQGFQMTSAPMLPKHILETLDVSDRQALINSSLTSEPIGTGPFKFKEWVHGDHITLTRNPDYWQAGLPCLDNIVMRSIPDGVARGIALENGEIDLLPMNSVLDSDIARFEDMDSLEVSMRGDEGLGGIIWLDVNNREEPLSDPMVRKAISLSLDRETIRDVIWYGYGVPARGPLVSTNPFFNEKLPELEFDLEKAAALLDEAGYPADANGHRFTITQRALPNGEKFIRLAEYVRQQLGKVGIEAKIETSDYAGWLKSVFTDYNYGITSTSTDNRNDPTIGTGRRFHTKNIKVGATFENAGAYSNPEVDRLFDEGAVAPTREARKAIFDEVQEILVDDMPVVYLLEIPRVSVWNAKVHGLITNGISFYDNWAKVYKEE
ncbi:ABC transporter substrate-binding protein [Pseudooceanicola nanhaiensis]|uniref:ABC transporter substrate-binding protein n=1 Tax=Pseudooceanicola nanhaiensis TaxID=375761 RepID=UPI001CD60CC6|nr:ABC transporter substrate-binding protein [Pseudooceanicola nanhaiensis]MCA0918783.1 ABC transporter substrate-binding protein [Pseudooceanicola nanhaiensis]